MLYQPSGTGSMSVSARQGTLSRRRWRGVTSASDFPPHAPITPSSVLLGILFGGVSRGCPTPQRPLYNGYITTTRETSQLQLVLESKETVADDTNGYKPGIDPHTESALRLLKILAGSVGATARAAEIPSTLVSVLSDIEQGGFVEADPHEARPTEFPRLSHTPGSFGICSLSPLILHRAP